MTKILTPQDGQFKVNQILEERDLSILMDWLTTTDYFTAPASTQYHGAEQCGLVNHSIAVYEAAALKTFCLGRDFEEPTSQSWLDDMCIATLLHDVCKLGLYKTVTKWRKDSNGKWESYNGYEINKNVVQIGHGVESLRIIEQHYKFNHESWAQAVAWHMGTPETYVEKQMYYHAVEKYPEVLVLHTADVYASFIMGY